MTKCPSCGAANLDGADECESCHLPLCGESFHKPAGILKRILEGTVADLKPKPARTIGARASVAEAVEAMRGAGIGCLLALEGKSLAGVLSEHELALGLPQGQDPSRLAVHDFLRQEAAVLSDDDPLADAFHSMAVSGNRHLPVRLTAGGYGVVSARDLLRYLCL